MSLKESTRCCAVLAIASCFFTAVSTDCQAGDWLRFRGPNGSGVADGAVGTPVQWSDTTNLKWSVELPGKGKSCPIVVGDRVILTCWTGESASDLVRHVICFDRATGDQLWKTDVEPILEEDSYEGMFKETGYTAHTPVSDGQRIFAFFGRCGIYAFDMEGNELWHKSVGTGSDRMKWGTASSPIIYKNLVIVTAGPESNTICAFDGATGDEVWKYTDESITSLWGTPVIVPVSDSRDDLVLGAPSTIWGLNPETGKVLWHCDGSGDGKSSVFAHDGVVYAFGGGRGGGGSLAVRAGGEGDVEGTHVVWRNSQRGGVGTPVFANDRIYMVSGAVASWFDPATGERIQQTRLETPEKDSEAEDTAAEDRPQRGPGGRGAGAPGGGRPGGGPSAQAGGPPQGGRRGGGFGNQDYSSPVVADGKLYFVARRGAVFVLRLGDDVEQLATNQFGSDEADFSSSPAIADGQIFIRSTKKLYCVAAEN